MKWNEFKRRVTPLFYLVLTLFLANAFYVGWEKTQPRISYYGEAGQ
jgi:hypothetical protein